MDFAAVPTPHAALRGSPRLLQDCAALARLTGADDGSARSRLERELGGELAAFLCRALCRGGGRGRVHVAA